MFEFIKWCFYIWLIVSAIILLWVYVIGPVGGAIFSLIAAFFEFIFTFKVLVPLCLIIIIILLIKKN